MEHIQIDETDIFLDDMGDGRGKIIISNTWGYNFSHFWGSMGSDLKEFLTRINKSYFINKLLPHYDNGQFDPKKTIRNVRKYIRTEFDIPWYQHMSAHKELREFLKELETCDSQRLFVHYMSNISDSIHCFDLNYQDEQEFKSALKVLECEPWHFIEMGPSNSQIFLEKLYPKLQKKLKTP